MTATSGTQVVETDGTWKASSGALTASDIMDGDQYDARLEKTGWDEPGYSDSSWSAASVVKDEKRHLVAQCDQPVGVIREIRPIKRTQPSPGLHVYDLGQNITGVVRITANGRKGTTITLKHAERLNDDGTLDVTDLKKAKSTDTYIMSGKGTETFQPKFTFHGFRRGAGQDSRAHRCDRCRRWLAPSGDRYATGLESGFEPPSVQHPLDHLEFLFFGPPGLASALRTTRLDGRRERDGGDGGLVL